MDLLKKISSDCQNTLMSHLGMEFTHASKDSVVATMPFSDSTRQRFGILHGGASAALAESVASVAGWIHIDQEKQSVVGLELSVSHLRKVTSGIVTATAEPVKIGRKAHVWDIKIKNEAGKLTCTGRCTLLVVDKLNA